MNRIVTIELEIRGMTCDGCAVHVRNALSETTGVKEADVPSWQSGRAVVRAEESTPVEALTDAVERSGYGASPAADSSDGAPAVRPQSDARASNRETVTSPATGSGGPEKNRYSIVIIGGGSTAFAAAIKASEVGGTAVILNSGLPTGGTCVNVGCMPSKTLIRAAEAHHRAAHPAFDGIETESRIADFKRIIDQKREMVSKLREQKYLDVIRDDPNITLLQARAKLVDEHTVEADGTRYRGENVLIATGVSPYLPDVPGLEENGYLTNENVYELEEVPEQLVVFGGGYIGLENAQLFARLGSQVTMVQRSAHVLSDQPAELGDTLTEYLEAEGIEILTNARIEKVVPAEAEKRVELIVNGEHITLSATHLLVATGRRGNTDGLGLENVGLSTTGGGYLSVDETLRTSVPTIFAAGDVVGQHQYVYTAAQAGNLAAENALTGSAKRVDYSVLPWVIFTDPQVAGIGMDEQQARDAGIDVDTATLSLEHVPRAIAARDTRGYIQLVRDRETDLLVGARILAPEGAELLMELALAMRYRVPLSTLASEFHPYLTLSEGIKLTALAFTKDVEKLSCCAV